MNPLSGLPNHTRIILLFLLAFFLIAVPLTSYNLGKNQAKILTSSPTPTPNPTANWKTFSNDKFSFKYPLIFELTKDDKRIEDLPFFDDQNVKSEFHWLNFSTGKPINSFDSAPCTNISYFSVIIIPTNGKNITQTYDNKDGLGEKTKVTLIPTKTNADEEANVSGISNFIRLFRFGNNFYEIGSPQNSCVSKDRKDDILSYINQILPTFKFTNFILSDIEKAQIDAWIKKNGLNQYGDAMDTMYAGGTPLFNEATGQTTDRYQYIAEKYPNRPWCTPRPACLDSTPRCLIPETANMCSK